MVKNVRAGGETQRCTPLILALERQRQASLVYVVSSRTAGLHSETLSQKEKGERRKNTGAGRLFSLPKHKALSLIPTLVEKTIKAHSWVRKIQHQPLASIECTTRAQPQEHRYTHTQRDTHTDRQTPKHKQSETLTHRDRDKH